MRRGAVIRPILGRPKGLVVGATEPFVARRARVPDDATFAVPRLVTPGIRAAAGLGRVRGRLNRGGRGVRLLPEDEIEIGSSCSPVPTFPTTSCPVPALTSPSKIPLNRAASCLVVPFARTNDLYERRSRRLGGHGKAKSRRRRWRGSALGYSEHRTSFRRSSVALLQ